jgi:GNAT superfamily N-acetyltransferase
MPSFAIRTATTDDIPLIISLQGKIWEPTYGTILSKEQLEYMFQEIYEESSLRKQMQDEFHVFFIITDHNTPVGFASVGPYPSGFKLHKIYVLPSAQGIGAGKFLLSAVESYCQKEGGEELYLNVNRYNKAKAFYERMGYVVVKHEDIPIGPYWMNDYLMKKSL